MIDALCVEPRFVPLTDADGWEAPILGTLERRPPIAPTPVRSNPGARTRFRPLPPISPTQNAASDPIGSRAF